MMPGKSDHFRKRRPKEIAEELLNGKLAIKRPLHNHDRVSVTADSTYKDFLADYLKYDERMDLLSVFITGADEAGNKAEAERLRNIEGWLTAIPLGAEPGTDDERRRVDDALAYRDKLDMGLTLPSVVRVVEKIARGEALSNHPLINDRETLADGIEMLQRLKEQKEMEIAISQAPQFREIIGDMTRGVENALEEGSEKPLNMREMIQRGAAIPPDPNQQEDITIETVTAQQRAKVELELIEQVTDKLTELGQALGRGQDRGRG